MENFEKNLELVCPCPCHSWSTHDCYGRTSTHSSALDALAFWLSKELFKPQKGALVGTHGYFSVIQ